MGDPKKSRRKFKRPVKPWEKSRIEAEKELKKKYGIRRKQEIWKMEAALRTMKRKARRLIAERDKAKEMNLLNKARGLGLISSQEAVLEDLLALKTENILDRRLQSAVVRKGFANTLLQARQFIVHGHIRVGDRKVTSPKYVVAAADEEAICFSLKSGLSKTFVLTKKAERAAPAKAPEAEGPIGKAPEKHAEAVKIVAEKAAEKTEVVNKE